MPIHQSRAEQAIELQRRQGLLDARRHDLAGHYEPDPETTVALQAKYDEAYRSLDLPGAPPRQPGESSWTYKRRLLGGLQDYAKPETKAISLFDLSSSTLGALEDRIIAEATAAAGDPSRGDFRDPDQLREVIKADEAGREIHEWAGNPHAWIDQFAGPAVFVRRFTDRNGAPLLTNRKTVG